MIACLSLPYFAAAVERRAAADLAAAPLVLGGAPWEPAPLVAFSGEAAGQGVQPGMSLRRAHFLAPAAHFLPDHEPDYAAAAAEVGGWLDKVSDHLAAEPRWRADGARSSRPRADRVLPARYFFDLDGLDPERAANLARQAGRLVRQQTRLAPAIGVAERRLTALIAASVARPSHLLTVAPEQELEFLARRPIDFLPLSIDTGRRLRQLGLQHLGQLQTLPPDSLAAQFDPELAAAVAQLPGRPPRLAPVTPLPPANRAEMVTAEHEFEPAVADSQLLEAVLARLAGQIAAALAGRHSACGRLRLAWTLADGAASAAEVRPRQPIATAAPLAELLVNQLNRAGLTQGVSRLTVSAADLSPRPARQLSLFDRPAPAPPAARLAARFAGAGFYHPAAAQSDHPLPERRFRLRPAGAGS